MQISWSQDYLKAQSLRLHNTCKIKNHSRVKCNTRVIEKEKITFPGVIHPIKLETCCTWCNKWEQRLSSQNFCTSYREHGSVKQHVTILITTWWWRPKMVCGHGYFFHGIVFFFYNHHWILWEQALWFGRASVTLTSNPSDFSPKPRISSLSVLQLPELWRWQEKPRATRSVNKHDVDKHERPFPVCQFSPKHVIRTVIFGLLDLPICMTGDGDEDEWSGSYTLVAKVN